jgi:hypothetical protein
VTISELIKWAENVQFQHGHDLPVYVMIEHQAAQFDAPANDLAVSVTYSGESKKANRVIIMHEKRYPESDAYKKD